MDPAKKGQPLEEDDEFEEFKAEDWGPEKEDVKNVLLWDKSWDDDSVNNPVGQQLRQQLPAVMAQQQAQ
ncbi:hypothetical protein FOA52_001993 [Chlamydomonas sp. UWO 241]|nr:hypothetical protein FOA52_001993 [Chlamydomonas sp. UWO 241]